MSFVIATDSRKRDEVLFMVDRRKQQLGFWSNVLDDALVYDDGRAAKRKAASFRFNNPRVLPLDEARRAAREQVQAADHEEAMRGTEMGWDGHKGVGP